LGVVTGLFASLCARFFDDSRHASESAGIGLALLLSAMPVFAAGLIEDLTQRVRMEVRLCAALVSAGLAGWLLGAWVVRLDVAILQGVIAVPAFSVIVTCLLVAGITNAFNIIDGFNGLAGGVAALILLGTAYVAFKVGDVAILAAALTALTAVGAIAGFMLLNFPRGLVYLGDGGAYLLGFWIGTLLVLLVGRNPGVSAWFPVLLCSYPVCELLFSMYRRGVVRRVHPGLPDLAHLHHLIYKRLVRWLVGTGLPTHRTQRNALTAPYLWMLTSAGVAPAVVFWQDGHALQAGSALFAAAYVFAYARIVKFRVPRWWVLRKSYRRPPHTPGDP
jgi:UDP-N-acetylmuramyl pentapeptide phosphotransferase/UDP-N-acetylglucosamine-1-phosphate transferase